MCPFNFRPKVLKLQSGVHEFEFDLDLDLLDYISCGVVFITVDKLRYSHCSSCGNQLTQPQSGLKNCLVTMSYQQSQGNY